MSRVVENVSGLVRRGLDVVAAELRALGFEVEATRIRAADVGAPHRRERILVLAYTSREQSEQRRASRQVGCQALAPEGEGVQRQRHVGTPGGCGAPGTYVGNPYGQRPQRQPEGRAPEGQAFEPDGAQHRDAPQPGMGGGPDGLPAWVGTWPAGRGESPHEWEPPRVRPVGSLPIDTRERLRAYGNAVVPLVGYVAGMRVREVALDAVSPTHIRCGW